MKTNINIENYEAYLLDYLEGNLSPDEAEQLKTFVAAQGLDWDELTEDLPHLKAPQIVYEDKEHLKKKDVLVPLYVKIATAAAAAGLLLTVTLWPDKSMPKLEPVANLKPITISRIDTDEPMALLPIKEPESMSTQQWKTRGNESRRSEANNKGCVVSKKEPVPLLVELPTKNITSIQTDMPWVDNDEPDFEFIAYRMNANLAFAQLDDIDFAEDVEEERSLSFIGKGIYRLTNGRHDSFASLFSSGFNTAKQEIRLAATDVALTAYHRADERIEGAKERWQEKHEE